MAGAAAREDLSTEICRHKSVDKSDQIGRCSDSDLVIRLENLATAERTLLPETLGCLAEVERRGLHLELGFANIFEYCVSRLKWAEGAAMQRIIAARTASLHNEIYSYLRDGQLHLSAVSRLAPFLTAGNRTEILARAAGRTRVELDELLGGLREEAARRAAKAAADAAVVSPEVDLPFIATAGAGQEKSSGEPRDLDDSREAAAPGTPAPSARARPVRLSFPADEELRRDLDRTRWLLKGRSSSGRIEDVIAYLLREFLRRCDPDRRKAAPAKAPRERQSRRIPRWVKDRVWSRDGGRCAYVAPDGGRCAGRKALEYDHIRPWARGGSSDDPANVRLLCRAHNLFVARLEFGDLVPPRGVSG